MCCYLNVQLRGQRVNRNLKKFRTQECLIHSAVLTTAHCTLTQSTIHSSICTAGSKRRDLISKESRSGDQRYLIMQYLIYWENSSLLLQDFSILGPLQPHTPSVQGVHSPGGGGGSGGKSAAVMKLITNLLSETRLRKSGAIPLLPPYAFVKGAGAT